MNKQELTMLISDKTGFAKIDTLKFLDAFIEAITETLSKQDKDGNAEVKLISFGTFKTVKKAASKGRNPRTGAEIEIPASIKAKFTPGKELVTAINGK
jgi:DNA-binding protein HU-beta